MPLSSSMIFKTVASVAVTADTPATVWTPGSGKKFRLCGYHLGATVAAASVIFKEGAGNTAVGLQTPVLAIQRHRQLRPDRRGHPLGCCRQCAQGRRHRQ
jgi:hypothetical protein